MAKQMMDRTAADVHAASLNRRLPTTHDPARLRTTVTADARRAADAIAPALTRFTR